MRALLAFGMIFLTALSIAALATEPPSDDLTKPSNSMAKKSMKMQSLKIEDSASLPKKLSQKQMISTNRENVEISKSILGLVDKAAATPSAAACSVTCDHEVGGLECPIGHACSCGCPGGYASCECK